MTACFTLYSRAEEKVAQELLLHALSLSEQFGPLRKHCEIKYEGTARDHRVRTSTVKAKLHNGTLETISGFIVCSEDGEFECGSFLSNDLWDFKYRETCIYLSTQVIVSTDNKFGELLEGFLKLFSPTYGFGYSVEPDDKFSWGQEAAAQDDVAQLFEGKLRDVYEFNVLSQRHLKQTIDEASFDVWLARNENFGQLKSNDTTVATWLVAPEQITFLRGCLQKNGCLATEPDLSKLPPPEGDDLQSDRLPSDPSRRDALLNKLGGPDDSQWINDVVSLEDFFEGNHEQGSIWCNLDGDVTPQEAYSLLKNIRAKPNVNDVTVLVTQYDLQEDWPFSDTILIATSASEDDIFDWFTEYPFDEITKSGRNGSSNTQSRMWSLWWD